MNILVTSIVDLKRSGPLRQHWFLKRLSEKHNITVVCVNDSWKAGNTGSNRYLEGLDLGPWETVYLSEKRVSPMVQEITSGSVIARILRQKRFDVHLNFSSLFAGYFATRKLAAMGVPTVYDIADDLPAMTAHAPQIPSPLRGIGRSVATRLMADTMRLAARTTFVTANLARLYPTERSTVLPNGVDTEMFKPCNNSVSLRRRLGLDGAFVVGWVGALRQYVDMAPVFEAVTQLENVKMLVVGDEGGMESNRQLANGYGLDGRVVFTGTLPFVSLPKYINAMDVCVMPLKFDNACPLSALQELACGKVVLTTRPLEIKCPAILHAPNAQSYRQYIEHLATDSCYRHMMGEQARSYVEQHHDWQKITGTMAAIVEEVTQSKAETKSETISKTN